MTSNSPLSPDSVHSPAIRYSLATRIFAYLQLLRPANIITALADILAGFAISGSFIQIIDHGNGWFYVPEGRSLLLLLLCTAGLYGGGVVLNDFFDAELDKAERPERPIPSKKASKFGAFVLGVIMLSVGIQAASFVSSTSTLIAILVACLAVIYDGWGKNQGIIGAINMGMCRGGNLLLGMSVIASSIKELWFISVIPILYIAAVTTVSRGEVHGNNGKALQIAGWLYVFVLMLITSLAFIPYFHLRLSLPFLVLFSALIFMPLRNAQQTRKPQDIGKAVKFGVLAIILMDAAIAAGFTGWEYALLIVCLLPVSLALARLFAVT